MMKYAGEMLSRFPGGVVDTKLYSNGRKTGFPFFFSRVIYPSILTMAVFTIYSSNGKIHQLTLH